MTFGWAVVPVGHSGWGPSARGTTPTRYFATVMLILIRLIQGFSVGGQLVGSFVYTIENAPADKRCFYGSFCLGAANAGTLLGAAVAALLRLLPEEQLMSWGWRLPFLSGILVAAFGMWMRHGVPESAQVGECVVRWCVDGV